MASITFNDIDQQRLRKLAAAMAQLLPSELVIGLVGTLGAGKTTLTQFLASETGVDPEDVTSPTFTLLCSYDAKIAAGPIRLHHLDAYRLSDEDEFLELGVEEMFDADNTWTLIEWADRVESVLPPGTLWITIEMESSADQTSPARVITITTNNKNLTGQLDNLAEAMKCS